MTLDRGFLGASPPHLENGDGPAYSKGGIQGLTPNKEQPNLSPILRVQLYHKTLSFSESQKRVLLETQSRLSGSLGDCRQRYCSRLWVSDSAFSPLWRCGLDDAELVQAPPFCKQFLK